MQCQAKSQEKLEQDEELTQLFAIQNTGRTTEQAFEEALLWSFRHLCVRNKQTADLLRFFIRQRRSHHVLGSVGERSIVSAVVTPPVRSLGWKTRSRSRGIRSCSRRKVSFGNYSSSVLVCIPSQTSYSITEEAGSSVQLAARQPLEAKRTACLSAEVVTASEQTPYSLLLVPYSLSPSNSIYPATRAKGKRNSHYSPSAQVDDHQVARQQDEDCIRIAEVTVIGTIAQADEADDVALHFQHSRRLAMNHGQALRRSVCHVLLAPAACEPSGRCGCRSSRIRFQRSGSSWRS